MFPLPSSLLPSVSDPEVEMRTMTLSEFNTKHTGGNDGFSIHAEPCIVIMKSSVKVPLDAAIYKNSDHPETKQAFLEEKFCTSVLFNDVMYIAAIFLAVDQLFSIQHKNTSKI